MLFPETPSHFPFFSDENVIGFKGDEHRLKNPATSVQSVPRHLDTDLAGVMKSGEEPNFERIPFILEAPVKHMKLICCREPYEIDMFSSGEV